MGSNRLPYAYNCQLPPTAASRLGICPDQDTYNAVIFAYFASVDMSLCSPPDGMFLAGDNPSELTSANYILVLLKAA